MLCGLPFRHEHLDALTVERNERLCTKPTPLIGHDPIGKIASG